MLSFSPEREKKQSSPEFSYSKYVNVQWRIGAWILLVFTHFFVKSNQFKTQQFFKIFNNKGSHTSGKLSTGGIILSSAAFVNSPVQHPGLHMAEPVQPTLY